MSDSIPTAAQPAAPPTLGPGRAVGVLAIFFATQIGVGVTFGLFAGILLAAGRKHADPSAVQRMIVGPVSLLGVIVGGACAFSTVRSTLKGPVREALAPIGWRPAPARQVALASAAGVGCALLFLFGLTPLWPPAPQQQFGPLTSAVQGGDVLARASWALLAVFVAPPSEEFVFRGALYGGFRRALSPAVAGTLVVVLFAAMHLGEVLSYVPALVAIALMGTGALVARVWSDSLVPAIALHASYNLVLAIGVCANPG